MRLNWLAWALLAGALAGCGGAPATSTPDENGGRNCLFNDDEMVICALLPSQLSDDDVARDCHDQSGVIKRACVAEGRIGKCTTSYSLNGEIAHVYRYYYVPTHPEDARDKCVHEYHGTFAVL